MPLLNQNTYVPAWNLWKAWNWIKHSKNYHFVVRMSSRWMSMGTKKKWNKQQKPQSRPEISPLSLDHSLVIVFILDLVQIGNQLLECLSVDDQTSDASRWITNDVGGTKVIAGKENIWWLTLGPANVENGGHYPCNAFSPKKSPLLSTRMNFSSGMSGWRIVTRTWPFEMMKKVSPRAPCRTCKATDIG